MQIQDVWYNLDSKLKAPVELDNPQAFCHETLQKDPSGLLFVLGREDQREEFHRQAPSSREAGNEEVLAGMQNLRIGEDADANGEEVEGEE